MDVNSDWFHLQDFIAKHQNKAQYLALATLTKVEGSSYRKPGARLLINAAGEYSGSLSGGCLEVGIAQVAKQVVQDGVIRTEKINTQPHFGCPGVLTFLIEKVNICGLLDKILHKINQRETFHLTTTNTGTTIEKSCVASTFTETIFPKPRLIVIGWTSDQEPLFQMAATLNWECIRVVKDSNVAAATPIVAHEQVIVCSAEDLAKTLPPDPQTAILIMSHHMATDFSFLSSAASQSYSYIGLLGSKRRREKLLTELGENGLLEQAEWTENLYAPVGLDIGATNPSTIALSILAEIQSKFNLTQKIKLTSGALEDDAMNATTESSRQCGLPQ